MIPMLRNKPRQLPSRADQPHPLRPHHTSFTPAEHQPRQTSFGKLVALASRDRAVGQKYQATNDDTVKMNRLFGEWEPEEEKKVEVEHHTVPMGPGYGRRPLQIDTTTTQTPNSTHLHHLFPDHTNLPMEGRYPLPAASRPQIQINTRLTGPQANNFRKVSAPRASFPPNLTKPPILSHPQTHTRPLVQSKTGPAVMRFADTLEHPGQKVRQDSPMVKTSRLVQDRIAALAEMAHVDPTLIAAQAAQVGHRVKEIRRQSPGHVVDRPVTRRTHTEQPSPSSRKSQVSLRSTLSADLNRPLPALPKEAETPTRNDNKLEELTPTRRGAIKRKSVPAFLAKSMVAPAPLVIPDILSGITEDERQARIDDPMSASQLIRNTLNWLDQNDQERNGSSSSIGSAGRREWGVSNRSEHVRDMIGSFTSSSTLSSMGVKTPPETGHDQYFPPQARTASDEDIARKLQALFNDLEDHQISTDKALATRLQGEEDEQRGVIRMPPVRRVQAVTATRTGGDLGKVHSICAHIEATHVPANNETYPAPLMSTRTGEASRIHDPASTPTPAPRLRPLVKQNTVPIGSTDAGQHFIPSGRSFDTVRQAQPAGPTPTPVQANQGKADIDLLRRELRPVKTGDRVSSLVQNYEVKASSRPSSWYIESPVQEVSTPVRTFAALANILGREHLIQSSELSMEGKRMMAEVRERRRHTHRVI